MTAKRDDADVIIVGLGAAGGVIAEALARAGVKVIALEKGASHSADQNERKFDEIRYGIRNTIVPGMRTDPMTWRPDEATAAEILPWQVGAGAWGPLFLPPSIGVGGGSIHWAAWAFRFRESEFRFATTLKERFGENALEGTTVVDWPFDYAELEPYYERAEREVGVSGRAGNLDGRIQPGGNPFEAPRKADYPLPPLQPAPTDALFVETTTRMGLHPYPSPAGIASEDYGGRSGCTYCGFCRDYACHVGAKASTSVTHVPAALQTGNLEIRTNARVTSVMHDGRGRATGVRYIDTATSRERTVQAPTVVLSAYALENARLLLVSNLNGNGQVGRNFITHNFPFLIGLLPDYTNPFAGPAVAASVIDDYTSELVDPSTGVIWGGPIVNFAGDQQPIEVLRNGSPDMPRFGRGQKEWMRTNYRRMFSLWSERASLPRPEYFVDLDPLVRDAYGQPALRITHDWHDSIEGDVNYMLDRMREIGAGMGATEMWTLPAKPPYHVSTHEVGVTRMGDDPATSVVNSYGRSHEVDNLFVVGGGQMPTYGAYNPTLTIWAMALRTADHLVKEFAAGRLGAHLPSSP